ncbi:unnamed protein product [Cunninghamella blakesleeana]
MYDSDLNYIAISYRWGELNEQQLQTPDYTAHITSFHLDDLKTLCDLLKFDPDLKHIHYLWIDAISIDQYDVVRKKKTILKMNQIYKKATYILAIPDLHLEYLSKNSANSEVLKLIRFDFWEIIHSEIFNVKHTSPNDSINNDMNGVITDTTSQMHLNNVKEFQKLKMENETLKLKIKDQEENKLKKAYQFLAYLIEDWSNRAWVISEYHIAKEKYMKYGTPLKYWFMSLMVCNPFFSYRFDDDDHRHHHDQQKCTWYNENDDEMLTTDDVIDSITFNQFVRSRFMQRSHLEMVMNSYASRNEDRFHAILPSWNEHKHLTKNVSEWKITDMTSVRLKLYEIMDNLWEKAALLYACAPKSNDKTFILPSFATRYYSTDLRITEKCNTNDAVYEDFEKIKLKDINYFVEEKEISQLKLLLNEYKTNSKPMWIENLINIQLDQHHRWLSVKTNSYFITNKLPYRYRNKKSLQNSLLLNDKEDEFHFVFIPFFTSNIPDYIDHPLFYDEDSCIFLVGNRDKNKWALIHGSSNEFESDQFCSDTYTFNIY